MERTSVTRVVPADPEAVAAAIRDVGPFMRAAGFDDVTVEGETVHLRNTVGFLPIELTLRLVDRADAVLAYEQVDGIFAEMATWYELDEVAAGTRVTGVTEFEVGARFVGPMLDATVVTRQRRRELTQQFDALEALADEHVPE